MVNYYDALLASKLVGGSATLQEKSVTITENGDSAILPDSGYDGLSKVDVSVNVSGGGENYEGAVFYDYDGTELYRFSKSEVAAMTELPPLPTQTGLICQEWNWSLANIKSYVAACDYCEIGANYITDDGRTRIYIQVGERRSPRVGIYFSNGQGTCDIDWGDGSPHTTISGSSATVYSSPHTYSASGEYVISLGITGTALVPVASYACAFLSEEDSATVPNGSQVYRHSIRKIEFGSNITASSQRALAGLGELEKMTLPKELGLGSGYILSSAFKLKSIVVPKSTPSLSNTFQNCYSLEKAILSDAVIGGVGSAFSNCYRLKTTTTISPSLSNAFENSGIERFAIFDVVSGSAFKSCLSLQKLTMPQSTSSNFAIPADFCNGCKALTEVKMPSSLVRIYERAFQNCFSLRSVEFGRDNSFIVGDNAFGYCYALEEVDLTKCTQIGSSAFTACSSLNRVTLGEGLISIGQNSFNGCVCLLGVTIPSTVTTINSGAFYNSSLKTLTFAGTTPPTISASSAFDNLPTDCVIYVPYSEDHSVLNAYKTATNYPNPSTYTYVEY